MTEPDQELTSPEPEAVPGSLIYFPDDYFERLNLSKLFPMLRPLEVEIGSGDGSFLVQYAQAHPERNFLGVERLFGRLRKIDRKGRRAQLANLRVMRIEAAYFLEYLLPASSVRALHIYFPDPWPKRKHRKNRLINAAFPELAHQVLEPNGFVYLRTDDQDYFEQMISVFAGDTRFQIVDTPAELAMIVTDFEREFNQRGTATRAMAYQRG
jgi:tRNA (guanine-N7-)-methyltransferase